jgi:hypothetical protein
MRTAAKDDDPTANGTAAEMKTRVNYLYSLLAVGLLDGYKTPQGQWRIRRASLDNYLKRRAVRQVAREQEEEGAEIPA